MTLYLSVLLALSFSLVANAADMHPGVKGSGGAFMAGVSKVNGTLPIGVPLAGYNHGDRRVPNWPVPQKGNYTTFMMPSVGHLDPTWVKCLVIDNGVAKFAFLTVDAIGSDGTLRRLAYNLAKSKGFSVPFENVILSASHTHSGPGAITPELLWALAPATDLLVPELQSLMASYIAEALLQAEQNLQPAQFGIGVGQLVGVTSNRRAGLSPYVTRDSIDPNLGVIRVDDKSGSPIATVFNFAMHGTCYGPENMYSSADIAGGANDAIESLIGGVSLFINADAGDIDPTSEACANKPNFAGAPIIAAAVKATRDNITTSTDVEIQTAYAEINFGDTDMNVTLARFANCTTGGPLDICGVCAAIHCDWNAHLGPAYIETVPAFTAARFKVNGVNTLLVTLPGEPLLELGWQVRNDTQELGFDQMILAGYSNNHMGYFTTPNEYEVGGYESQLTMWGINTAEKIRAGCKQVAAQVAP